MSVETEVLDKAMRDKLDAAAQEGCSPKGHSNLVQFLVMSYALDLDTRKEIHELPERMKTTISDAIKQNQPTMMEVERFGIKLRINGQAAVAKAIKYGTAALFALYVLGKVHGWGGPSWFNVGADCDKAQEPMKTVQVSAGGTP